VVDGTLEDLDDEENLSAGAAGDDFESHQLFKRVRDMAQERPDDAARVLRGWIYQQDSQ
jgi:flagellar biosynthesis/type III secretory pathway M-ring protein FliF/YscJ